MPRGPGQALEMLPPLREDLRLFAAGANRDGSPAWMVQDPVSNRFFRLGWLEFEVLSRWALRDPERVARAVNAETTLHISADQVCSVRDFLRQQQLVSVRDTPGVAYLAQLAKKAKLSRWKWLLHNYLFIRLPLVRPQRFMQALAPWCDWLYSRTFAVVTGLVSLLGVFLALRQWDVFVGTFADYFSPAGITGYLLALMFAKTLHEFGHAITATRLGVRVAHMGVAFLVLWPMLYTDTGESWKLTDKRDRFRIAAAGMAVELALAGFATLIWSLTNDGPLRSAMFFLATTSWIITLGINASPFMRFDGYFLLSDALDLPNLHARSFALARAKMRRVLWAWHEPDPEYFEPGLRRFLIVFAWLTWVYRLVVFIGIALAVYLFFFKVLGVFLFAVEIAWFIARPVWNEVRVWIDRRRETGAARLLILGLLLALILAPVVWPWQRTVSAQAWLYATQSQTLYSPFAARLVSIRANGPVRQGQKLAVLDSPETRSRAVQLSVAANALQRELNQSVGRRDGAEQRNLIIEQLSRELAQLASETDELDRLKLIAPYDGVIVDRDPQAQPGGWISAKQPLAILIDPRHWSLDALLPQTDVGRIQVGAQVSFYIRNEPGRPFAGLVRRIDSVAARALPNPAMATQFGGPIATVRLPDGRMAPRDAYFRVRIELNDDPRLAHNPRVATGIVNIDAVQRSVLLDWFRQAASVLLRESGF